MNNEVNMQESQSRFLVAYRNSYFNVTQACKETGISRSAFYKWMQNYPDFKEQFENALEEMIDIAQTTISKAAHNGDVEAAYKILTKVGKKRDWNPTTNVDVTSGGKTISFNVTPPSHTTESEVPDGDQL